MSDLIQHMAADFADEFRGKLGDPPPPADGFTDHLIDVFGEDPSDEDVCNYSEDMVEKLYRLMAADWIDYKVKKTDVRRTLKTAVDNNCDPGFFE